MILFVNACVRKNSRTKRLAECLLSRIPGEIRELRLSEIAFPVTDEAFLEKRDRLTAEKKYDDPLFDLARQFAEADTLVIAAPFWDLSFPASLRQYLEQVNVPGITFRYTEEGIPVSLCRARKLYYVTTAGGYCFPEEYGYGYVKALAENFYGISDVRLIRAAGLDIEGIDAEQVLRECMENLKLTEQTFIE